MSKYVVGSTTGIGVSSDLTNWSYLVPDSVTERALVTFYSEGLFGFVENSDLPYAAYVYTSPDPTFPIASWRRVALPNGLASPLILRFLEDGSRWILLDIYYGVYVSDNYGATWIYHSYANAGNYGYGIAKHGYKYVIVGSGFQAFSSPDLVTWTAEYIGGTGFSVNFVDVASNGTEICAVNEAGEIWTANALGSWTRPVPGTGINIRRVKWTQGMFVATGSGGTVFWRNAGMWLRSETGISANVNDFIYDEPLGKWIAVMETGQVCTSPDLETWTQVSSLTAAAYSISTNSIENPLHNPADGITFTPRTIETPFKAQSGNLRRNFVQGAPVFEADLKFEVDYSEIEAMDAWIDSIGMGTFSRSAFAIGNADTVFQVLEPPTRSFSHKGMTVSMSVTATQDVPAPLPAVIGNSVPVICPFPMSGQGSLGGEVQQLTEATGGRSTAKAFMAPRGERMTFTYATDKVGLAQFISWWSAYTKCGHRGFFASMPGRTAWYFEFVEQPKFTLKSDLGTVSLDIVGRSSSRELSVTGGVPWISNGDTMTISIVSRFILVDSKNVIVDPMLYSTANVGTRFTTITFLAVPVGEYRWLGLFDAGSLSKWNDITVAN